MDNKHNVFALLKPYLDRVHVRLEAELDEFTEWDKKEWGENKEWLNPFDLTISARCIFGGNEFIGQAFLGGNWAPMGSEDTPEQFINSNVDGYLADLTEKALADLRTQLENEIARLRGEDLNIHWDSYSSIWDEIEMALKVINIPTYE
jgi:hypothetical protein